MLKLDGSFVRDLMSNPRSESLVRGIAQLGRGMNIETVEASGTGGRVMKQDVLRARPATTGGPVAPKAPVAPPAPPAATSRPGDRREERVRMSKRRVAQRWSQRSYSIQPGSISATCAPTGATCRVKGVMSWKLFDAKTAQRTRGTSSIEYRIALAGDAPRIVAEARSVQGRPSTVAAQLEKARRDLKQLLRMQLRGSRLGGTGADVRAAGERKTY